MSRSRESLRFIFLFNNPNGSLDGRVNNTKWSLDGRVINPKGSLDGRVHNPKGLSMAEPRKFNLILNITETCFSIGSKDYRPRKYKLNCQPTQPWYLLPLNVYRLLMLYAYGFVLVKQAGLATLKLAPIYWLCRNVLTPNSHVLRVLHTHWVVLVCTQNLHCLPASFVFYTHIVCSHDVHK